MARLPAWSTLMLAAVGTATAFAAEPGPKYVTVAQPTRVFVVAGLGERCSSEVAPQVEVITKPTKGQVVVEAGVPTTIQYSLSGHCIGTPARGLGITYISQADASGDDRFSIRARMPSGAIATRDFIIRIRD